jgi:hypothetical protein
MARSRMTIGQNSDFPTRQEGRDGFRAAFCAIRPVLVQSATRATAEAAGFALQKPGACKGDNRTGGPLPKS